MAVDIADLLTSIGYDVSWFTMTKNPRALFPQWDKELHVFGGERLFTQWAADMGVIVWTTVPTVTQVQWASRRGITTVLCPPIHEMTPGDRSAVADTRYVISPLSIASDLFRSKWRLQNFHPITWAVSEPVHNKPAEYRIDLPKVLMPLWDGNSRRTEMTSLEVMARCLQRGDSLWTVVFNASTLVKAARRFLIRLRKRYPHQLTLISGVPPSQRFCLFQTHDLTYWPTHFESTCRVGVSSITQGTPVITFHAHHHLDYFDETNAFLVPPKGLVKNDLGLEMVLPDYGAMDEHLRVIFDNTPILRRVQRTASSQSELRKTAFIKWWACRI